ncbi:MAG: glycine--tRNA ligase subunit beta [Desulfovibrionaceae bacterium]|nr:glycine--tRNA ligase subunit beta [Desulfovibrionaceae bacterium]
MATFLLEIGTEELPARFLAGNEQELQTRFEAGLKEAELGYGSIRVVSTPRRATVCIKDLEAVQPVREDLIMGPPSRVAFDANGQPSKAAEGFARTNGVEVSALERVSTEKGEYLAARVTRGGAAAADVLKDLCPAVISSLPFAKRMHWGSGTFAFARPIRWILALLDEQVVSFEIGGVSSGRQTYGHREHGPGPFSLATPADYAAVMEKAGVMPSAADRRAAIIAEGNKLAASAGGSIIWEESLLDEVQGLCEHPVPLLGDIDPCYLEVPREVLLTSMETHQKSFGVQDANGVLLPHFLTVLNMTPPDRDLVKKGWERVLRARLEDARFFWRQDLADTFDDWLQKLDTVIFLAPLGSMGEKTRRISELCRWLAANARHADKPAGDLGISPDEAARAGRLSKADLVSSMVGEFDTLQGIMGGIYAHKKGEPAAVANALPEQYLPAGPDSPVPSTELGALLSIADKADTLVGCFGLGMIPTGTADPYALRRAALGIARIMIERNLLLDLNALFTQARALYGERKWKLDPEQSQAKLREFFSARVKNLFLTQGHNTLFVEAVTNIDAEQVWLTGQRLAALEAFGKSQGFAEAVQTFKRVANIIRKQGDAEELTGSYSPDLLEDDAEKALATQLDTVFAKLGSLNASADFSALLETLGKLRPYVDAFFDHVMVMCDNADVRKNRLNLLKSITVRLNEVADFSALQL